MRAIVLSVVSGLIVVAIPALLKYIGRKIRAVRESRVTDVKITYSQITSEKNLRMVPKYWKNSSF